MLSAALALAVLVAPAPQTEETRATSAGYDALKGFSTVLVSHLNTALGTENLPGAMGLPVTVGAFVTIGMEHVQMFDRHVARLQGGRVAQPQASADCKSGCSAQLFDGFQAEWLELAIESRAHSTEIPDRVLFAAHRGLPAKTLIEIAYAAAETRPVQPPQMALLLNGGKAGLRTLPFFLVPPTGLQTSSGSQALGLTVSVGAGGYTITAADRGFGRTLRTSAIPQVVSMLADIQKRYPSKLTLIYKFEDGATVEQFVTLWTAAKERFPITVLSAGQRVLSD